MTELVKQLTGDEETRKQLIKFLTNNGQLAKEEDNKHGYEWKTFNFNGAEVKIEGLSDNYYINVVSKNVENLEKTIKKLQDQIPKKITIVCQIPHSYPL